MTILETDIDTAHEPQTKRAHPPHTRRPPHDPQQACVDIDKLPFVTYELKMSACSVKIKVTSPAETEKTRQTLF